MQEEPIRWRIQSSAREVDLQCRRGLNSAAFDRSLSARSAYAGVELGVAVATPGSAADLARGKPRGPVNIPHRRWYAFLGSRCNYETTAFSYPNGKQGFAAMSAL
jgi:hypothetical protein